MVIDEFANKEYFECILENLDFADAGGTDKRRTPILDLFEFPWHGFSPSDEGSTFAPPLPPREQQYIPATPLLMPPIRKYCYSNAAHTHHRHHFCLSFTLIHSTFYQVSSSSLPCFTALKFNEMMHTRRPYNSVAEVNEAPPLPQPRRRHTCRKGRPTPLPCSRSLWYWVRAVDG
jgi:hypothetical protein